MRRRTVAGTGLALTELGFGAAPIGGLYRAVTDETAEQTLAAAWDAGVRYFDTAPHYGLGLSERRLGRFLRTRPRGDVVVSTKVGRILRPVARPAGSDLDIGGFDVPATHERVLDYSRDGVRRSLDDSLARLGLDRVDIVYVHDPDDHVEQVVHETLPALVELRDQGVVGAIGAGMNGWQPLHRMVAETDVDIVMVAGRWTLLDRSAQPLLDLCAERGVSVSAAAPFNSGLLARDVVPDDARFDYGPAPEPVLAIARGLAARCRERGVALPAAALQFPLRHPAVASVVTGFGSAPHVESAAAAIQTPVPSDLFDDIDEYLERTVRQ